MGDDRLDDSLCLIEPPDLRLGGEKGTESGRMGGLAPGCGRGGDLSGIGGEPIRVRAVRRVTRRERDQGGR